MTGKITEWEREREREIINLTKNIIINSGYLFNRLTNIEIKYLIKHLLEFILTTTKKENLLW